MARDAVTVPSLLPLYLPRWYRMQEVLACTLTTKHSISAAQGRGWPSPAWDSFRTERNDLEAWLVWPVNLPLHGFTGLHHLHGEQAEASGPWTVAVVAKQPGNYTMPSAKVWEATSPAWQDLSPRWSIATSSECVWKQTDILQSLLNEATSIIKHDLCPQPRGFLFSAAFHPGSCKHTLKF